MQYQVQNSEDTVELLSNFLPNNGNDPDRTKNHGNQKSTSVSNTIRTNIIVWISYSQRDSLHQERVKALWFKLREDGFDARLDINKSHDESWSSWIDTQFLSARWIIVACDEHYQRDAERNLTESPQSLLGSGVKLEYQRIGNEFYENGARNHRIVAVLFQDGIREYIPSLLRLWTYYHINTETWKGYQDLSRLLQGIAEINVNPVVPTAMPLQPRNVPMYLPIRRSDFLISRDCLLSDIEDALLSERVELTMRVIGLYGLGGTGKTQLSLDFVVKNRKKFSACLWITADGTESLISTLARQSEQDVLDLMPANEIDVIKKAKAVGMWLARNDDWLLVIDNADNLNVIKHNTFIPMSAFRGYVIITSRSSEFDILGIRQRLSVPTFTKVEATNFLIRRADFEKRMNQEEYCALEILVDRLQRLPLALEQVGAYLMRVRLCSFSMYLERFNETQLNLLGSTPAVISATDNESRNNVLTTWTISISNIKCPLSYNFLLVLSYVHPDKIPISLIEGTLKTLKKQKANLNETGMTKFLQELVSTNAYLSEIISDLTNLSLVSDCPLDGTISIHRLVQETIRDQLKDKYEILQNAVQLLNYSYQHPKVYGAFASTSLVARRCVHRLHTKGASYDTFGRELVLQTRREIQSTQ